MYSSNGRATGSPLHTYDYFGNIFLAAAMLITYLELLLCLCGELTCAKLGIQEISTKKSHSPICDYLQNL